MADLSGFPAETFAFLADLRENNNRDWFAANRARYEAHYLAPALAFIEAIGPRLTAALPGDVRFEPRVNGSLFRINRDIRFSQDKRPYKDHIDMWFWTGEKKGWETPGYFMRLLHEGWAIGAGMHHFSKQGLEAYRAAVIDDARGQALQETVERIGPPYEVGLASRKTVPRGYDASHPRARFLLYEGLVAVLDGPLPPEVGGPGFVDTCLRHFEAASPINRWLADALAS